MWLYGFFLLTLPAVTNIDNRHLSQHVSRDALHIGNDTRFVLRIWVGSGTLWPAPRLKSIKHTTHPLPK